jgi:hypothetical protein
MPRVGIGLRVVASGAPPIGYAPVERAEALYRGRALRVRSCSLSS